MLKSKRPLPYQHRVEGTVGTFLTDAGAVHFLQTKARLNRGATDNESRLTSQLAPVREVLKMERLNFNQLLQRDLDDHRVATQLIPYLLESRESGPAFFPPILAALLPFNGAEPEDTFPTLHELGVQPDEEMHFMESRWGAALRFQRLCDDAGNASEIAFGRLSWNAEKAKLVVLDGQHRAMALIAIFRTLNDTWGQSSGARFSHFYEHRIRDILSELRKRGREPDLSKVEFPVTVCWFPDATSHANNPHRAARKLFVDVNQNARQPSRARLVLLSDSELVNVFTRSLLNRLRTEEGQGYFPLYAIEYDNPDEEVSRPVRWSVVANLDMLRSAVDYSVFGPTKYITNMGQRFGGRPAEKERDQFMRAQLRLKEFLEDPLIGEEREYPLGQLGDKFFPLNHTDRLVERFISSWGEAILRLLSQLLPYKVHIQALTEFCRTRLRGDSSAALAYDALFEGVGMYWTLRDSATHYDEQVKRAREEQRQAPMRPEIVKAWDIINAWKPDFTAARAERYLGKSTEQTRTQADQLYETVNTHACLMGAVLTLGTLAYDQKVEPDLVPALADQLIAAWNKALTEGPVKSRNRLLIFSKHIDKPLNQIPKMDTPLGVYMRYFWLELLCTDEAAGELRTVDRKRVQVFRDQAREAYMEYLVGEKKKALKQTMAGASETQMKKEAEKLVARSLQDALEHWFKIDKKQFKAWHSGGQRALEPESPEGEEE